MKRKGSPYIADGVMYLILLVLALLCFIPVWHVFNMALSTPQKIAASNLMLWPKDFTLASYQFIFRNDVLLRSLGITVFITVVGTALNLLFTTSAAYVLAKRDLPGGSFFLLLIVITMLFGAGIIPGYMLVRSLGLIDTVWSLIFPGMILPFNLILMRNFIWSVPESLTESAKIDGAGELRILSQVIIPLSMPAIATIGLFYGVGHWNEFFRGIFYINDVRKWPLQVLLRSIVSTANLNDLGVTNQQLYSGNQFNVQTIQSASIVAATIPIVMVYPFLQKYFTKGIMLGAVKG